ncbi:MFS general substrate transporter [Aspergillus heteromorphus CBS 117.55]|uniref:Citrate exporter 1 n=1 Tax=Aspergillus heteromorphus CBS 117.55 TaxID=1448321 RepID=A0A317V0T6_9EURO|nr:MFS general substrate transporter [Aspergillus heteromorphus CBS 117.55]PWY67883.1 MFS general substrate transporter [Aspergillus heteromorphus CBS 117.55]
MAKSVVNEKQNADFSAEDVSSATEVSQDAKPSAQDDEEVYTIFSKKAKILIVMTASFAGLFSPLSANIYLPALDTLADELHVSDTLINLTVTTYMIFQGLAPAIFGGLADSAGRRPAYIICFTIYIAANIGLALQRNYAALLVLRCLQSTGSSSTIALANAIVADVVTSAERGLYIGYSSAGSVLGPSIGPIIGGILTQYLGWPSTFWFLTICAGVFLIPLVIFLPETARKIVGNGSRPPPLWNLSVLQLIARRKSVEPTAPPVKTRMHFPNPLTTLAIIAEKEVFMILLGNSLAFAGYYAASTSVTSQFGSIYGFNDVQIGLCFIPVGIGCLVAAYTQGLIADWNYRRHARRLGITVSKTHRQSLDNFPIERVRTEIVFPMVVIEVVSMIAYGWVLHYETNLAGPLILLFFIGYTSSAVLNIMSVLMVDIYPESPATATAANNITRCWLGACATAVILPMIEGIGRGWAFTVVGLFVLLCMPAFMVVWKWGHEWRNQRHRREETVSENAH